jgi:hypothetical protein
VPDCREGRRRDTAGRHARREPAVLRAQGPGGVPRGVSLRREPAADACQRPGPARRGPLPPGVCPSRCPGSLMRIAYALGARPNFVKMAPVVSERSQIGRRRRMPDGRLARVRWPRLARAGRNLRVLCDGDVHRPSRERVELGSSWSRRLSWGIPVGSKHPFADLAAAGHCSSTTGARSTVNRRWSDWLQPEICRRPERRPEPISPCRGGKLRRGWIGRAKPLQRYAAPSC